MTADRWFHQLPIVCSNLTWPYLILLDLTLPDLTTLGIYPTRYLTKNQSQVYTRPDTRQEPKVRYIPDPIPDRNSKSGIYPTRYPTEFLAPVMPCYVRVYSQGVHCTLQLDSCTVISVFQVEMSWTGKGAIWIKGLAVLVRERGSQVYIGWTVNWSQD